MFNSVGGIWESVKVVCVDIVKNSLFLVLGVAILGCDLV